MAEKLLDMPALSVTASTIAAGLGSQTWSLGARGNRPFYQAFFVSRGRATLCIEGQEELELPAPAALWLPRRVSGTFVLAAGSEGAMLSAAEDFVWRTVDDSPAAAQLHDMIERIAVARGDNLRTHAGDIGRGFEVMTQETQDHLPGGAAIVGAYFSVLLLLIWRASGASVPTKTSGTGATTLQRFRQIVELRYREQPAIAEIARAMGITYDHLHRVCIAGTGRRPMELIHERQIAEAKLRLGQSEQSVEQIGFGLGFRDPAYFSRFFKSRVGEPPGAYRRRIAAQSEKGIAPSFAAWP
ncbi:AraC family transcriptional activator of pobA [Rhizobium sp. BK529]|uniref:helix-turn-helix domain-containing protein n=1 Tax=unclassified Rhizobium TaxID=2613769 RepID=UPI00104C8939|nr:MULTISPECIES: helix-turn-helix domain-containing protein [unclassified Rhizobium]MBB3593981.1 AraC family transcriptional activator of pobA [Rhizobium sp. BK529]TCS01437.1 AraC family transcriptional activator of pobA [Rhizobium sp. BK418]